MLAKSIEKILNEQLEKEFYSSNLYLSMSVWAASNGYEGVSQWLKLQANEEYTHMEKFKEYIIERGGKAKIPAIAEPPAEFKSVKEVFEQSLKHEQYVSACINKIVDLTLKEKDYSTNNWIAWFVKEQIEEEASVQQLLDKLKLAGDKFLYAFDKDILSIRAQNDAADAAE